MWYINEIMFQMKIKFSLKLNAIFARYEWMNVIKYLNLKCLLLSNGWIFFCFFQFISAAFVFFLQPVIHGLHSMLCSNEWIFILFLLTIVYHWKSWKIKRYGIELCNSMSIKFQLPLWLFVWREFFSFL